MEAQKPAQGLRALLVALPRSVKQALLLVFDSVAIVACLWAALAIRWAHLDWVDEPPYAAIQLAVLGLVSCLPVFYYVGLYRAVMRYANRLLIQNTIKAIFIAALLLFVLDALLLQHIVLPRSVPFIFSILLAFVMLGARFLLSRWLRGVALAQLLSGLVFQKQQLQGLKVAVVGSGEALDEFVQVLVSSREYQPVCIVDQSEALVGGEIHALPVFALADLASAMVQLDITELVLALPELSRVKKQQLITELEQYGLPIRTMPNVADIASGRLQINDLQDVDIVDVLGRDEVHADEALMASVIHGKSVLVTGAGGSIGSEICRQLLKLKPAKLILLDHSEFLLYQIEREIQQSINKLGLSIAVEAVLANASNKALMDKVFAQHQPQLVYHAAAYKHVPMVEANLQQGLENNIWGTIYCAQAAMKAKVERFVLISTDKAVRPTNFMGASKRISELALQLFNQLDQVPDFAQGFTSECDVIDNSTQFSMVRFGNVLGSSGSVIPLFKEQIQHGGPVTVTHPDIIRYFMSIPEASNLVIQASAMAQGGEVFVLDMGEPIKIVDVAHQLIRLSGLTVLDEKGNGDIAITFTGLRPGEKLFEELLIGNEPESTQHERIMKANELSLDFDEFKSLLCAMDAALKTSDLAKLQSIVACEEVDYRQPEA